MKNTFNRIGFIFVLIFAALLGLEVVHFVPQKYVTAEDNKKAVEQHLINVIPTKSELQLPPDFSWRDDVFSALNQWNDPDYLANRFYSSGRKMQCGTGQNFSGDYIGTTITIGYYSKGRLYSDFPKSISQSGLKEYPGIPASFSTLRILEQDTCKAGCLSYGHNYSIEVWKNANITYSVKIDLQINDLQGKCPPPYNNRKTAAIKFAESECDRLAKIIYPRLPDSKDGTLVPPATTPGAKGNQPSPGQVPGNPPTEGKQAPLLPDSALPLAAGATAAVALIGSLIAGAANGISPREAIYELMNLSRGRPEPAASKWVNNVSGDSFKPLDTLNKEDPKHRPDQIGTINFDSSEEVTAAEPGGEKIIPSETIAKVTSTKPLTLEQEPSVSERPQQAPQTPVRELPVNSGEKPTSKATGDRSVPQEQSKADKDRGYSRPETWRSSLSDSAEEVSKFGDKVDKSLEHLKGFISDETREKLEELTSGAKEAVDRVNKVVNNPVVKFTTETIKDVPKIEAEADKIKAEHKVRDNEAKGIAWSLYTIDKTFEGVQNLYDGYFKLPKIEKSVDDSTKALERIGLLSPEVTKSINEGTKECIKLPTNVSKEARNAVENTVERLTRSNRLIKELELDNENARVEIRYDILSDRDRKFIWNGRFWKRLPE